MEACGFARQIIGKENIGPDAGSVLQPGFPACKPPLRSSAKIGGETSVWDAIRKAWSPSPKMEQSLALTRAAACPARPSFVCWRIAKAMNGLAFSMEDWCACNRNDSAF